MDAWRWLGVQGAAVKCARQLSATNQDLDRLALLLLSLPALEHAGVILHPRRDASPAAFQAFLAAAALALARCSRLQRLDLDIELDRWGAGVRRTVLEAAEARALERLMTGLAGLTRLRALTLELTEDCIGAPLPACTSCLAQLTYLCLGGFVNLVCAPGWARLPALECLEFRDCMYAADGEEALPGMDTLVSLTSLSLDECPSLRALPTSLWRLSRLCSIVHYTNKADLADLPRSELPFAGLPATAPCFAFMTHLTLAGHNWPACPPGILAMRRLKQLDLSRGCFEHLPEGVSALTALEGLRLGRHTAEPEQIGGAFDARALGCLARFPFLRELSFNKIAACFSARALRPRPRTPA